MDRADVAILIFAALAVGFLLGTWLVPTVQGVQPDCTEDEAWTPAAYSIVSEQQWDDAYEDQAGVLRTCISVEVTP